MINGHAFANSRSTFVAILGCTLFAGVFLTTPSLLHYAGAQSEIVEQAFEDTDPSTTSNAAESGSESETEVMEDDAGEEEMEEEPMEEEIEVDLSQSLLFDSNGDGVLTIIAFGDSLTRGTGDFIFPGMSVFEVESPTREAGYPLRLEFFLGIPVSNFGNPGEVLTEQGVFRFAETVPAQRPDIVIISGGSNDGFLAIPEGDYTRALQTMINVGRASGATVVLASISPVCCERTGLIPFIETYNRALKSRAVINDLRLADIDKAYRNSCNVFDCRLLNIPEGLHPNESGHDVNGEVVAATLLGIDVFDPLLRPALAVALGTIPEALQTVADPLPPTAAEGRTAS